MSGRLIAVVGPSGVGKDSVMHGIAAARPDIALVRRDITRAPGLGGETYTPLSEAEFAARAGAGAYCLHWGAHGLYYGIPASVLDDVTAGAERLVNLSRGVLEEAHALFPRLLVLHLTARPETLAARIAGRGRESAADIAHRLSRPVPDIAPHIDMREIANDGPLEETVTAALHHLDRVNVP